MPKMCVAKGAVVPALQVDGMCNWEGEWGLCMGTVGSGGWPAQLHGQKADGSGAACTVHVAWKQWCPPSQLRRKHTPSPGYMEGVRLLALYEQPCVSG